MAELIVGAVNLKNYCTTFGKLDDNPESKSYSGGVCDALYPNWKSTGNDVSIYFNKKGNVLVPEYAQILGQRQIVSWHTLSFNKGVGVLGVQEQAFNQLTPEIVSYFIAGAFSMNAIPYSTVLDKVGAQGSPYFHQDLDPRLINGINQLRQGGQATLVSSSWKDTVCCRINENPTARLICEYDGLASRIPFIEQQIEGKTFVGNYEGQVQSHKNTMTAPAETIKDMENKIRAARSIVAIAMSHQKGEVTNENQILLLEAGIEYSRLENLIKDNREMFKSLRDEEKKIPTEDRNDRTVVGRLKVMNLKITAANKTLKLLEKQQEEFETAEKNKNDMEQSQK